MRLLLEKLLCSRLLQYLREPELKRLRDDFISLAPGEFTHTFFLDANSNHPKLGRSIVGNFTLVWQLLKEKEQDKDGNLWSSYALCFSISLRESYSMQGDLADRWLDCLGALEEFSSEIKKLNIPKTIKEKTHTSAQREALEKIAMKEKAEEELSFFFMEKGRDYIKGMRVGGKSKNVPYAAVNACLPNVDQTKFILKIKKHRWSWSTHCRHYQLTIDHDKKAAFVQRET